MSFLDLNLNNVEDLKLVPDGEYLLQCLSAEVKSSQKGAQYINMRLSIPAEPLAEDIYYILMLPEGNDPRKDQRRLLAIKTTCQALGVDIAGQLNLDDFVGKEGWANITTQTDDQYGDKNQVKSFLVKR